MEGNRTIWKYEIPATDIFDLFLPAGSEVLSIQLQMEKPCIWFSCDPSEERTVRHFKTVGTGHSFVEEGLTYIGTYQMFGGAFVGHVFEIDIPI